MAKTKKFHEEVLDFAQTYMASAIQLAKQHKTPYQTIVHNYKKGHVLCAHFLIAHGIELYLKFLIKLLGGNPPSNKHNLSKLLQILNPSVKKILKRKLFSKIQEKFIKYLDRYEKFRYPINKNWQTNLEIFNEAQTWNQKTVDEFIKNCEEVMQKLNYEAYKINEKLK